MIPPQNNQKVLFAYAGLGLSVLGFLIYANSFSSPFQFDDQLTIVNSPAVRHLKELGLIFQAFNTRFLTGLTFALNYQFGGLNVFGFHLVNTIIHILNAMAVFAFVHLLFETPDLKRNALGTDKNFLALSAALIFLAHPLQTQAVTYITQRATSMATLFYLGSLILYLRFRLSGQKYFLIASFVVMILGMFTKEMAVTIPLMLVACEMFFFDKKVTKKKVTATFFAGSAQKKWLSPFFLSLLIIPLTLLFDREASVLNLGPQVKAIQFDVRNLLTEINVLRTYLRLLFLPVNQNLDYDYPITQGLDGGTVLSLVLLSALAAAAFWFYNKNRLISFCIAWFFITTSVEFAVCSLVGKDMIFEHYLYLPMVGFAIFVSTLVFQKGDSHFFVFKKVAVTFLATFLAVIVFVLSILTYQRNKIWHDQFSLWHDVAQKSPNKYRPYTNLGVAYRRVGDYDKAIIYHHKALSLGPIDDRAKAQIYVNLGAAYGNKGLYENEIAYCQKAVELDPHLAQAYSNMGYAYSLLNRYDEAIHYGEKAVSLSPYSVEFFNNLGVAYAGKGEITNALKLFEYALKLEPTHQNALQNRNLAQKMLRE